ncbi:MAG: SRPBCC domain-containing protein [Pseudomonadota bacterium]
MPLEPIKVVTKINRRPEEVFDAFMSKISDWWPLATHSVGPFLGEAAPEIVVFEGHEGGKIYEVSERGEHRVWGTVLKYQAGRHVSFSWHPGLPESEATTVSVDFEPTDDGATLVTLVHTGWEARGDGAAAIRENYVSGWADIIQNRFTAFTNAFGS